MRKGARDRTVMTTSNCQNWLKRARDVLYSAESGWGTGMVDWLLFLVGWVMRKPHAMGIDFWGRACCRTSGLNEALGDASES